MKLYLSLAAVVCFAAVTLAQNQNPGGTTRPADGNKADKINAMDGTWTVVCMEKNGQPAQDAKDMTVTIKDGTITCNGKDSKPAMTVKFDYTGPGQAKVTMTDGSEKGDGKEGAKEATYILTGDYLAVCIHHDKNDTGAITTNQPNAKSKCSIILKRSGSGNGTGTGTGR